MGKGALYGAVAATIPFVEVRTNVTPTIRVATSPGPSTPGGALLRLLRPQVTAFDASGAALVDAAPYGRPDPVVGAVVAVSVIVALLAGAFMAGRWSRG